MGWIMTHMEPSPEPTTAPAKSLGYWWKTFVRLWHGDQQPSRFDTRLQKLSRHREEGRAGIEKRMLKTTSTARWWRRFR